MEEMVFDKKNGLVLGHFTALNNGEPVKAFFSTRTGGVSPKPFDTLNLGLRTGDAMDNILSNRRRFFAAAGIDENRVVRQMQVHGEQIRYVNQPGVYEHTDATYTDQPDLWLTVTASDCVPVMLYEPKIKLIAVVHAGWQGTALGIAEKTVRQITGRFETAASDFIAVIGPSICPDCMEVGEDVAGRFEEPWVIRNGLTKPHLDLWKANYDQLYRAGVRDIHTVRLCTKHMPELFFSHRGSGGQCGRMIGVVGITY